MPQVLTTNTEKVSTAISVAAVGAEVIAVLVVLWRGVLTDYLATSPPDAAMATAIGFSAAMVPAVIVGLISSACAMRPRYRLALIHVLLAVAGLIVLLNAGPN